MFVCVFAAWYFCYVLILGWNGWEGGQWIGERRHSLSALICFFFADLWFNSLYSKHDTYGVILMCVLV